MCSVELNLPGVRFISPVNSTIFYYYGNKKFSNLFLRVSYLVILQEYIRVNLVPTIIKRTLFMILYPPPEMGLI